MPAAAAVMSQQGRQDQARPAQPQVPFPQASKRALEGVSSFQFTPGAAPINIGPFDLSPNGFLRGVWLVFKTVSAGTLGAGVVADGWPFKLLQNVQFLDTGGQKMDDLNGWSLLQDNIWGGEWRGDPRGDFDYSASGITPHFALYVPRELFPDGRGSLPNLSGSQKYRIRLNVDALANLFTTAPTTAPTLQVDVVEDYWLLPAPQDGGGRPQQRRPALLGLAQYRTSYYPNEPVASGAVKYQLKSTGNLLKYVLITARDGTGARNDNVFPDPFTFRVDNSNLLLNVPLSEVLRRADRALPAGRTSRDTGVLCLPFDYGLDRYIGGHGVASWFPTSTATYLEIGGRQATNTAGTFEILACEISTAEIDQAERASMGSGTGTWQAAIPADVAGGV